jgi:hypothetical protein
MKIHSTKKKTDYRIKNKFKKNSYENTQKILSGSFNLRPNFNLFKASLKPIFNFKNN